MLHLLTIDIFKLKETLFDKKQHLGDRSVTGRSCAKYDLADLPALKVNNHQEEKQ